MRLFTAAVLVASSLLSACVVRPAYTYRDPGYQSPYRDYDGHRDSRDRERSYDRNRRDGNWRYERGG